MSDRITLPPDDDEALAAEYVLGVLDLSERMAAEARARSDAAFAARVDAWVARLAPLNDAYAEEPPPDLLPRLEARLFPVAPKPRRSLFGWLAAAGAAAALALAVAVMLPPAAPPAPALVATLAAEGAALAFEASYQPDSGTLTLTRTAGAAPAPGQDHQLWAIGADGVPVSLGLISAPQITRAIPALAAGTLLAVSLEAAGGSVTGVPNLPPLVAGALTGG